MCSHTKSDRIEHLTTEYRDRVAELEGQIDFDKLRELLMSKSEWSERGSTVIIRLARLYGSFVLTNAVALAEALEIEDGEAGL